MLEFGFNEAQLMFQEKARDFAARVLIPGAKERCKQNRYPMKLNILCHAAGPQFLPNT